MEKNGRNNQTQDLSLGTLFSLSNYAVLYVTGIFLARWLGADDYGNYMVAVSVCTLAVSGVTLGLEKLSVRELIQYEKEEAWGLYRGFLRAGFLLIFFTGILFSLAFFEGFLLYRHLFAPGLDHPILVLCGVFVPVMALALFYLEIINVNRGFVAAMGIQRFLAPALVLVLVALFENYFFPISSKAAVALYGGAWLACLLVEAVYVLRLTPEKVWAATPQYNSKKWVMSSLPFAMTGFLVFAINASCVVLVEICGLDEKVVGYYAAAMETSGFISMIFLPMTSRYFTPSVLRAMQAGDLAGANAILRKRFLLVSGVCALFFLVILFWGKTLLALFSPGFVEGYAAMVILTIGAAVITIGGLGIPLAQYLGKSGLVIKSFLVSFCMNVALALVLVGPLEEKGVALAFTLSTLAMNAYRSVYIWKEHGLRITG